ncbi:hypothetical protein GGI00_000585, partial [Coemansia sp. RSA 2681]
MSGKGKQPRVKGNLKPTSSSRAADLLGGDMSAINAFKANPALAFSQLSRPTGASPSASQASTPSPGPSRTSTPSAAAASIDQIDGKLASQIKRLGKNDSTTKIRALFELKSYANEHTWETGLEGMMLAWPPLFKRHIFDPDRRVRVAVAGVHAALVKRCGKRLAPNLKLLIGAWVASYFDPHRDVGKASRLAFELVFPESKRTEAYAYCIRDILDFATDNIVNQTADSLSDARFADAEEMRSKYEHVVGASFGALALAIEEVPTARLMEEQTSFGELLGSKEAMAFVGDRSSTFIRRSVYRLVRIVMLKCPELVGEAYGTMAQALLSNCFSEADPNAHGDMWDAVLLLTKNYPQAWSVDLSKKKKGMFEFLSSGKCRLAPTISYPSILALLANLPSSIVDEPSFQSAFGDALWKGASATAAEPGSRAYHQENVGLVSAICECFSFLWTRTLKSSLDNSSVVVGKEAAKEVDRLWHFYLQHPESFEEMSVPIVKLYAKIDSLSVKYAPTLFEKVWTHASWFALQRVSDPASMHPIVYLITQIIQVQSTALLADSARKLVSGFCLLAVQAEDRAVAQRLIQTLTQLAPEVVFQEGFSGKFSARLEGLGSQQEAIDLVVSRAQYLADEEASVAGAAQSIDAFIKSSLGTDGEAGLRVVAGLLAAVSASELAKTNVAWQREARLPLLEQALVSGLPSLPLDADEVLSSAVSAPSVALIRLYGQSLLPFFRGAKLVSTRAVHALFEWTCRVFQLYYEMQWTRNVTRSVSLDAWTLATCEVLSAWITLARDETGGPRFVEHWLDHVGSLGLLFDFATAPGEGEVYPQAKRCWAAVEAQVASLGLGMQLAQALSAAISADVGDLRAAKDPAHLARLAHAVYARICPAEQRDQLVNAWALDPRPWALAIKDNHLSLAGSLRQAVDTESSFHTLTHWAISSEAKQPTPAKASVFDVFGLSRLARRAMFVAEFVRLSHLDLADSSNEEEVADFVLNLTLAFVLLRESLLAAEESDILAVVRVDSDPRLYARVEAAARSMQEIVSSILESAAVIPGGGDASGWLATLAQHTVGRGESEGVWARVVAKCIEMDAAGAWALVLGTVIEWSQWAQPLANADIESALADPLARHLETAPETAPHAAMLVIICRATQLRQRCVHAPAMRSALLDSVKHAANAVERCSGSPATLLRLVAALELLAELIPADRHAALDSVTTAKIVRILLAVPDVLAACGGGGGSNAAVVVAALTALQRFAECMPVVSEDNAVAVARLCLRWIANAGDDAVLSAASRAVAALAQATTAHGAVGPVMRQLGEQLLDACVLCDRPLYDGVRTLTVLVRCDHMAVPKFDQLYPVLVNAMPRLSLELLRLILSSADLASYTSSCMESLVGLVGSAAKSLKDLGVPLDELSEAVESDEYIRCAALRLLLALLLVAHCADAMAQGGEDLEQLDKLAEMIGHRHTFDDALPWICALLGLGNNPASAGEFNPKVWDVASGLDLSSWVNELSRNPGGDQLFPLLAFHVLHRLAWSFPATLRSWWTGLSQAFRGTSIAVEAFMAKYVCPLVI